MYYSQLLQLVQMIDLNREIIEKVDNYFTSLDRNTNKTISVSKMNNFTNLSTKCCLEILEACSKKEIGILVVKYSVHCPECGLSIMQVDDFNQISKEAFVCYGCEEEIEIGPDDISISYELRVEPDFYQGQHNKIRERVANYVDRNPEDSLATLLQNRDTVNEYFFAPNEKDYKELESLYKEIFLSGKAIEKGNRLERLITYLFNLCPVLKARGIKTDLNQIDCFVSNKKYVPFGIFSTLGTHFYIECKNESKTPSGTYISKLDSIISEANCNGNQAIKFGIIVSKRKPPRTYAEHAKIYYMSKGIIIISLYGEELKELIDKKQNLLELLERKIVEITDRVCSDLKKIGLYQA